MKERHFALVSFAQWTLMKKKGAMSLKIELLDVTKAVLLFLLFVKVLLAVLVWCFAHGVLVLDEVWASLLNEQPEQLVWRRVEWCLE